MSEKRIDYGSAVQNGMINYLSPTGMTNADPQSDGGCYRAWAFKYVAKIKPPQTAAQATGVEMHAQLATYARTGAKALGPLALTVMHYVPTPGTDLRVEFDIGGGTLGVKNDPRRTSSVFAAGIPIIGDVDLAHDRGHHITADGPVMDPPGTIEVIDYKSTSSHDYMKTAHNLADTIQMSTYGKWAITVAPSTPFVRLSHIYAFTRKREPAEKVTVLVPAERIARRWEYIERLSTNLQKIAGVSDPNLVDANTSACGAFRGCPYRDRCTAHKETKTLDHFFGRTQATMITENMFKQPLPAPSNPFAMPAALPAPTVSLGLGGATAAVLAAEQAATLPPPPPAVPERLALPEHFAQAVAYLDSAGYGWPVLTGDAARAVAQLRGHTLSLGGALTGSGVLASQTVSDPQGIVTLATQAHQAKIAEAQAATTAPAVTIATEDQAPAGDLLPPGAPTSDPAKAAVPVGAAPAEADKPKRGRPPKAAAEAPAAPVVSTVGATPACPSLPLTTSGVCVFVDAIPRNRPFESLQPYVDAIHGALCNAAGTGDARAHSENPNMAYGGWKGALAALARSKPPAAGTYALIGGDEIARIVAEALSSTCDLYVVGVA